MINIEELMDFDFGEDFVNSLNSNVYDEKVENLLYMGDVEYTRWRRGFTGQNDWVA